MDELNPWTVILQAGPIGAVLLWFMWAAQSRLDRIERAIDRSTRASILDIMSRPWISDKAKEQANTVLKEIEVAEAQRKNGTGPAT